MLTLCFCFLGILGGCSSDTHTEENYMNDNKTQIVLHDYELRYVHFSSGNWWHENRKQIAFSLSNKTVALWSDYTVQHHLGVLKILNHTGEDIPFSYERLRISLIESTPSGGVRYYIPKQESKEILCNRTRDNTTNDCLSIYECWKFSCSTEITLRILNQTRFLEFMSSNYSEWTYYNGDTLVLNEKLLIVTNDSVNRQ
jgi:hypothetical protein